MAKEKGKYVDGFVMVVYKKHLAAYKKMAQVGEKVWRKHGALDYKECMADDVNPAQPEVGDAGNSQWGLPFPKLTKAKPDEVVFFSFIVFKSRKHRDSVNAKVMKDPLMNNPKYKNMPMPFDMKRMSYGGFKVLVG